MRLTPPRVVPPNVPLPPDEIHFGTVRAYVMSGGTSGLDLDLEASVDGGPAYEMTVNVPSCDRFRIRVIGRDGFESAADPLPLVLTDDDYRGLLSARDEPLGLFVKVDQERLEGPQHRRIGWRTVRCTGVRLEIRELSIVGGRLTARMFISAATSYAGEGDETPATGLTADIHLRDVPLGITETD